MITHIKNVAECVLLSLELLFWREVGTKEYLTKWELLYALETRVMTCSSVE